MNKVLKQIIVLLALASGLGIVRFLFLDDSNFKLIQTQELNTEECDVDFLGELTEAKNLDIECVKEYFDKKKAVIIDSRTEEEYRTSRIMGSINLYADDFQNSIYCEDFSGEEVCYLDENSQELPFDQTYIIYCNGGTCPLSKDLAGKMYEKKFKRVYVYEGGLPEWKDSLYPIEGIEDLPECQLNQTNISLWYFLFAITLTTIVIISASRWNNNNTYAVVGFRLILGLVFIYASYSKIVDPIKFSSTISLYKATPVSINNLIALIVPWLELLIGFGLILNRSIKGSILLSISLFITFIILLSQAYFRGFTLDCGCFSSGDADKLSSLELRCKMLIRIIEDIIYLFMSSYLYFIYIHKQKNNAN